MPEYSIVGLITTPLALVALFFLLCAGVIRLLASTRRGLDNKNTQMLIHYGFLLGVILSFMANVGYYYQTSTSQLFRVAGTVRGVDGKGIPNAVIDLPGRNRTVTQETGIFEMIVLRSRLDNDNLITIVAPGYMTHQALFSMTDLGKISIQMKRPSVTATDLFSIQNPIQIQALVGVPQIVLMSESRGDGSDQYIRDLQLSLRGPNNENAILYPGQVMMGSSPPMPYSTLNFLPVVSSVGEEVTVPSTIWFADTNKLQSNRLLLDRAFSEMGRDRFSHALITSDTPIIAQRTADELVAAHKRHFIWTSGDWTATLECNYGGKRYSQSFSFSLAQKDVDRLDALKNYYRYGLPGFYELFDVADAQSAISVQTASH